MPRHLLGTLSLCLWLLGVSLLLAPAPRAPADEARFFYDQLGRLVRVSDEQGNVATWIYDAVGNILSIERSTVKELQPQITGIAPNQGRQGTTVNVTILGSNLAFGVVTTDNPGITVTGTKGTDTEITTAFTISAAAPLGTTTVTVDNGAGKATTAFTVAPPAPGLIISPSIVLLEPNGKTATINVELSNAEIVPIMVTFTGGNSSIAALSPTQVTIPAGQTLATVTVTSGASGTTAWVADIGSGKAAVSIYVAAPFSGPAFIASSSVGVGLPAPLPPVTPLEGPRVSVGLPAPLPPVTPMLAPLVSVGLAAPQPPVNPLLAPLVGVTLEAPP